MLSRVLFLVGRRCGRRDPGDRLTAPRGCSHGELSLSPGPFLGTMGVLAGVGPRRSRHMDQNTNVHFAD